MCERQNFPSYSSHVTTLQFSATVGRGTEARHSTVGDGSTFLSVLMHMSLCVCVRTCGVYLSLAFTGPELSAADESAYGGGSPQLY